VIPCAGTGQDGEIQKGLTRAYVDSGDGTITDTQTMLTWEKLSFDGSIHDVTNFYTWDNAFTKTSSLNAEAFAGHTDWRLPNVNELQSLANYGAANPAVSAAFNTGCGANCTVLTCSCTMAGPYWSSTTNQDTPSAAWLVVFDHGEVFAPAAPNKGLGEFVRAVRGGL
jgi:uncharacterized protein DUF1566